MLRQSDPSFSGFQKCECIFGYGARAGGQSAARTAVMAEDSADFPPFVEVLCMCCRYCLLPTAYCLLPAACCLLPAACCLLPAACCLLPAACCLLPTAHCPLPTAQLPDPRGVRGRRFAPQRMGQLPAPNSKLGIAGILWVFMGFNGKLRIPANLRRAVDNFSRAVADKRAPMLVDNCETPHLADCGKTSLISRCARESLDGTDAKP